MNFVKIFFSLLLFSFVNSCFAESNDNARAESSCADKQVEELISNLRNVTKLPVMRGARVIVISDSEDQIYPPLREKLKKDRGVFFINSLQSSFNSTIEEAFKIVQFLDSIRSMKIIIHANSIDRAAEIFQDFTNIFANTTFYYRSISIAVTLDHDDNTNKLIEKLNVIAKNSKREDIFDLVNELSGTQSEIVFFNNNAIELNDQKVDSLYSRAFSVKFNEKENYRMSLNKDFEEKINCAIPIVNQKILNVMKENVMKSIKDYFDDITKTNENDDKVLRDYNYFSFNSKKLLESKSPRDFLAKIRDIVKYFNSLSLFEKNNFFSENIDVIQFLFSVTPEMKFSTALTDWHSQLGEFELQDKSILNNWHQRYSNGWFYKRKYNQSCINVRNGKKFQVHGDVVTLSDIDFSNCPNIKHIELFAFEKVLIDIDLKRKGEGLLVTIIAPIWEVLGNRTIDLSGENGKPHMKLEAKSGSASGNRNGEHGLAGFPGTSAGSFYGVANAIIKPEQLTIVANGGDGGPGQNGGHGVAGKTGDRYDDKKEPKIDCTNEKIENWTIFERYRVPTPINYAPAEVLLESSTYCFKVFGKEGRRGGNGGNGGAGGVGGKSGNIIIQELSKRDSRKNSVIVSAINGNDGPGGFGGSRGSGGIYGENVEVCCTYHIIYTFSEMGSTSSNGSYGPSGMNGKKGTSVKQRKTPKKQHISQNFPSIINEFKLYARPILIEADSHERNLLTEFYNLLNTHKNISKWYDTLSLIEEFTGLEQQYFHYHKQMNLTSSYFALRDRILKYIEKTHLDEDAEDYINILRDMYKDITIKLEKSFLLHDIPVVPSIEQYFKELHEMSVEPLQQREEFERFTVLLEKSINPLDEKIEEAEFLINEDIQNSIYDLESSLDQEIDSLLGEITGLERKDYKMQDDLKKMREELQEIIGYKLAIGALKVGLGALGLINPALGFVGAIVASAIPDVEAGKQIDAMQVVNSIPKIVKTASTETEKHYKSLIEKQQTIFEEQEKYINEKMKKTAEPARSEIKVMWESAAQFRDSNANVLNMVQRGFAMKKIYGEERSNFMTKLEEAQREENKQKIEAYKKGLEVADYLKVTSEVFETGSKVAIEIMKDASKFKEINDAATTVRGHLENLNKFETSFYNNTMPMLKTVVENLGLKSNERKNMSENELLLDGYKTANIINNLKHDLGNLVTGFNVSKDIEWTFNKFISTFDIMEKMYNKILEYKNKKSEFKFQANLHIAHYSILQTRDIHLRSALAKLQVHISYNKISEAYDTFIHAFKQYTFPIVGSFLEGFKWPDIIQRSDVWNTVHEAQDKVQILYKQMKSTLEKKRKFQKDKVTQTFGGSLVGKPPFYVWNRQKYNQEINDILSGKATKLEAKMVQQIPYDALKCNRIEIVFTSDDREIERKINATLQTFTVNLTHHGDSVYKCDKNLYEIKNAQETLKYTYEKNIDGTPFRPQVTYMAIRNGDYTISPYATWTIQLTNEVNANNFKLLEQFKGKVNLELIGDAEFLGNGHYPCPNDINKYYKKLNDNN